jgi:hypothetical protein
MRLSTHREAHGIVIVRNSPERLCNSPPAAVLELEAKGKGAAVWGPISFPPLTLNPAASHHPRPNVGPWSVVRDRVFLKASWVDKAAVANDVLVRDACPGRRPCRTGFVTRRVEVWGIIRPQNYDTHVTQHPADKSQGQSKRKNVSQEVFGPEQETVSLPVQMHNMPPRPGCYVHCAEA